MQSWVSSTIGTNWVEWLSSPSPPAAAPSSSTESSRRWRPCELDGLLNTLSQLHGINEIVRLILDWKLLYRRITRTWAYPGDNTITSTYCEILGDIGVRIRKDWEETIIVLCASWDFQRATKFLYTLVVPTVTIPLRYPQRYLNPDHSWQHDNRWVYFWGCLILSITSTQRGDSRSLCVSQVRLYEPWWSGLQKPARLSLKQQVSTTKVDSNKKPNATKGNRTLERPVKSDQI